MPFAHSFNSSVLPVIWPHAYISLILEKGDSTSPAIYRSISVARTTSKIMESIIKDYLSSHLLAGKRITKQKQASLIFHHF